MKKFYLILSFIFFQIAALAQFAGLQIDTIYHEGGNLSGYKTYRLYARFVNESDQLIKLFGGADNPSLALGCNNQMFQHPQGGPTSLDIDIVQAALYPDLQWDSYVTIGIEPQNLIDALIPDLLFVDQIIDFSGFESGSADLVIAGDYYLGWHAPYGSEQNFAGEDKRVMFAQLTSNGDIQGRVNIKILSEIAGIDGPIFALPLNGNLGCTDPTALNFDGNAVIWNNSCIYNEVMPVPGCTDPGADNYNPEATVDDGSCVYPVLEGCTDADAINYDPNVEFDNGTCIYGGCTDPNAINYDQTATEDDGSCLYGGCTDPEAINFDPTSDVDNGSCLYAGCTDSNAVNYNPIASVEDGSCLYAGCTDTLAVNYDPNADVDDGSCNYAGCQDQEAINYDPTADTDDGSCLYAGCTDPEAENYNPDADVNDGSCTYPPKLGCMDPEAINYDPTADTEDGSCLYAGCTDPEAENYNPDADVNDGSCTYPPKLGCMDPEAINYDPTADTDDGSCLYAGCTDPTAENFNENADIDDGSCIYAPISGCTDPLAANYNPNAVEDDGTCLYPGCTDALAINFAPNANTDDGTCIYNCDEFNIHPEINQLINGSIISVCDDDGDGIYTLNAIYTGFGEMVTQILINWGDESEEVLTLPVQELTHTYDSPGQFEIQVTAFGQFDCIVTNTYTLSIENTPQALLSADLGDGNSCVGDEIVFHIENWENNDASTIYTVHFSDGSPSMIFNHPPPSSFGFILPAVSCGLTAFDGTLNAVSAKVYAENACGAVLSIGPAIYVSGAVENSVSSFVAEGDALAGCTGAEFTIINTSLPYVQVSSLGCTEVVPSTWFISPEGGYTISSGSLEDPSGFSVIFNDTGEYTITLAAGDICGANDVVETINITIPMGELQGVVNLNGTLLSDVAVMAYQWSTDAGEFELSATVYTDENGSYSFDVPEGNYQIKAMPDMVAFPEIIPLYTNEVPNWDDAEIFETGCNTIHESVIELLSYDFSGVDIVVSGGVYYRDIVKNLLQGDPIPGIPIIVEKDTTNTEPIVCTMTDELGNYVFTNLHPGNYKMHVDMPGLPMAETHFFTIDEDGQIISGLNFYADSLDMIYITDLESVNVLEKPTKMKDTRVYPNPSMGRVVIDLPERLPAEYNLEIVDALGRPYQIPFTSTVNQLILDFGNVPSGSYHYRYRTDVELYDGTIIIQH